MGGMRCVLPHPTSEAGKADYSPSPVQQVSPGVRHGKGQAPSLASQLSVRHDASLSLFTPLATKW